MFGFMIKKWFFTLWDNLLVIILMNLAITIGMSIVVIPFFEMSTVLRIIIIVIGVLGAYQIMGIVNGFTLSMAKVESLSFRDIGFHFKKNWKAALALGISQLIFIGLALVAFQTYSSLMVTQKLDPMFAYILIAIVFWLYVFWLVMSSFIFPFNAQQGKKIRVLYQRSFYIYVDNIGFSFFVGLGSLVILIISVITGLMFPGITGIILWNQTALKLRMYKYDYLENRPDEKSRKIPWPELLMHEKDLVGPRSLRNMIFPWKD